jgi:hypothetical protein
MCNLMGNIYGEESASSLEKIIAGKSKVYARGSSAHLAYFSPQKLFNTKGAQNYIGTFQ